MASFHLMCSYFRANQVLQAEIEQWEQCLEGIKRLSWLNLSVDCLTRNQKNKKKPRANSPE